jgi:hypothetical protein
MARHRWASVFLWWLASAKGPGKIWATALLIGLGEVAASLHFPF